jgi:hypothetical protein
MVGSVWQNKPANLMARKQERKKKGTMILFEDMPPVTKACPTRSYLLKIPPSPNSVPEGPNL